MKYIEEIRKKYAAHYEISETEYTEAKEKLNTDEFSERYTKISNKYAKVEYPADEELKILVLENKLSDIKRDVKTLKTVGIFFAILTGISLIISIVSVASLSS